MSMSHYEEMNFANKLDYLLKTEIKEWASNSFGDREFLLTLIKAISLSVPQVEGSIQVSEAEILGDALVAKKTLRNVLHLLMKNAVIRSSAPLLSEMHGYSTGELAKFFGVSQTTINKWIDKGRFAGVKRQSANQQIRISGDTWFTASTGAQYQVKDAVEAWEEEEEIRNKIPKVTEAEMVANYMEYFRNKYQGEYEDTLGKKSWDELTDEEETDASIWTYFRERYLNGPQ